LLHAILGSSPVIDVVMSGSEAKISLRVHPSATRNELVGLAEGAWRVKILAPPVKGKANKELIAFLSQLLGVSQSTLTIVKGHTTRNKVVAIDGLSQEEVTKRLSAKL